MNIHEYQAKELLREFDVPVSYGRPAFSVEEAVTVGAQLKTPLRVVKAQIHAGGRGKGGGVKIVKTDAELRAAAETLLGMTLVTHQTSTAGQLVRRLYIEEGADIKQEFYLSLMVDRACDGVAFIVSTEGGTDIEEVAAKTPEKIFTMGIDPATGFCPYHGRQIAAGLKLKGAPAKLIETLCGNLYRAFWAKDMSLLEINPLVRTKADKIICLDAKINFDSNALYRHPEIVALRDTDEEDPTELAASQYDLNFIKLDGTIGCMVNGAGLAMATMDIIQIYGGRPANFLDVGGGATKAKVTEAFKIILSEPGIEGILVNIFGGIMRCDVIAEGVVLAAQALSLTVPLVVRLAGTNVAEGKAILEASDLTIIAADDLDDAARKITQAITNKD